MPGKEQADHAAMEEESALAIGLHLLIFDKFFLTATNHPRDGRGTIEMETLTR